MKAFAVIAIVIGFLYFSFTRIASNVEDAYPRYSWNQKLILEVETPNGVKRASSTYEVLGSTHATFGLSQVARLTVAGLGEAVVMEFDSGQFLFVLLGDALAIDLDTFRVELLGSADARYTDVEAEAVSKLGDMRISAPLARNRYPMFVTFDDIDDPASVRQVDPDDLAASFGPGYALKSLTLEITDEPVTLGEVQAVLGVWLGQTEPDKIGPRALELPNDSPRGWKHLGISNFISYEYLKERI